MLQQGMTTESNPNRRPGSAPTKLADSSSLTARYVQTLQRSRWCVLVGWLVATACAAPFAVKLGSTTTDNFSASPGTPSKDAVDAIQTRFPNLFDDRETIYIQCFQQCDCSGPNASECPGFAALLDDFGSKLAAQRRTGVLRSVSTYFNFTGSLFSLGSGYHNKSAKSMKIGLEFDTNKGEDDVKDAVTAAQKAVTDLASDRFHLYLTGKISAQLASTAAAGQLIGMTDGMGMLLIVFLFGWQTKSWRLTLIPILNTVLCLIVTEGLVFPLSNSGAIILPSYVPNVVLFLAIALSVDYSFFHLSRFQELRAEGVDLNTAVLEMVTTAGRVVLVSGVVLLFCWLSLAAFPVFGTNTLGYCASIAIFVCILVNITMNPTLILAFPVFFGNTKQDPCHCCRRREASARVALASDRSPFVGAESATGERTNCYGVIASRLTTMPWMIVVPLLVYALLLPGAVRLFTADLVVGGISGGTPDTNYANSHILEEYPSAFDGVPLTVLLQGHGVDVQSEEIFAAGCQLAKSLQASTNLSASSFRGVMISAQKGSIECSTWESANNKLLKGGIYAWAWGQSVNAENTSTLLSVSPPFDAFSDKAKALVDQARRATKNFKNSNATYSGWTVEVYHPMAIEVDAEELTASRFTLVVFICAATVFTIIAIRYQAALIPIKLFFTIALPIVSVLGTGAFVFQDGYLEWTGIPSLKSQGGVVWINPIACTFMLIGFALDYDLFLFSRIYADRKSGIFLTDREAIIHAVAKTGPVITTAGVIMALAFSGMIVQSTNPFLCQMGFTMIYGIIMDTFVVRTLLVPAILSMAGRFNWWPGVMPECAAQS